MSVALVGNILSPISSKISFRMKTKLLVEARNLQVNKTLLTLELSQDCKSGSMFSSSEPVAASSDIPVFKLAHLTRPSCARARPQELGQ